MGIEWHIISPSAKISYEIGKFTGIYEIDLNKPLKEQFIKHIYNNGYNVFSVKYLEYIADEIEHLFVNLKDLQLEEYPGEEYLLVGSRYKPDWNESDWKE